MSEANVTYKNIFFVTSTQAGEHLIAKDNANGKYIAFQNNTANDVNVLLFAKPNSGDKPAIFAVHAGGALGWPMNIGSFEIWTAQTEPPGDAVPPAGAGGAYNGPNKAPNGAIGYVTVVLMDQPLAPFSAGNPTTASASLSGSLPAGTNNIGSVDVAQMPDTIPSGFTWAKVTATAAGTETVKATAGSVAALVKDAGSTSVTVYLEDGGTQAWNAADYSGPQPIACLNSIQVNFSAAGSAWILYK